MKKLLLCLCVLSLLFVMTACDPSSFQFDYDELKSSVVRVEYIYYDNPDAVELFEQRDKVIPFDFDKMEIRQVLPDEELDDFLKELSKQTLLMVWRHDDSPKGDCIRVVYDNGDFEILSCDGNGYCGAFYANGQVKRFIGCWGRYSEFWLKWFDIQK